MEVATEETASVQAGTVATEVIAIAWEADTAVVSVAVMAVGSVAVMAVASAVDTGTAPAGASALVTLEDTAVEGTEAVTEAATEAVMAVLVAIATRQP